MKAILQYTNGETLELDLPNIYKKYNDIPGILIHEDYGFSLTGTCDQGTKAKYEQLLTLFIPKVKAPAGHAVFLGMNGYDHELEDAKKILKVGKAYKVTDGRRGTSSTTYRLGDLGWFNSVMFDAEEHTLPIRNTYAFNR